MAAAKSNSPTLDRNVLSPSAVLVPGYTQFGGKHNETAAVKNMLHQHGIVAPHTGKPYTEAMLLGIGGGIGANYWTFEMPTGPELVLSWRHLWEAHTNFLAKLSRRVGLTPTFKKTTNAARAEAHLRHALASGRAAIVWLDRARIPYFFMPGHVAGYFSCVQTVVGTDDARGEVLLDGRAATPLPVLRAVLAQSRAGIPSYRHRLLTLDPSGEAPDLKAAILEGLRDCLRVLYDERVNKFGLSAIPKWADLVANPKDKKGWPRVFPPGLQLYRALVSTYDSIETAGTGGSAFRSMYADFLKEASVVLDDPAAAKVAAHYREAACLWSALASAALPDSVGLFRETTSLLRVRTRLFEEDGAPAIPEIGRMSEQLRTLEAEADEDFPLSEAETADLLANLRDHILKINEAETEAARALRALLP